MLRRWSQAYLWGGWTAVGKKKKMNLLPSDNVEVVCSQTSRSLSSECCCFIWCNTMRYGKFTCAQRPRSVTKSGGQSRNSWQNVGVKRRMWTAYSKKWGSADPLDPVAPRPLMRVLKSWRAGTAQKRKIRKTKNKNRVALKKLSGPAIVHKGYLDSSLNVGL